MGAGAKSATVLAMAPLAIALTPHASAGAWTDPPGKGKVISSVSSDRSEFGDGVSSSTLLEIGIAGGWGAALKYETQTRDSDFGPMSREASQLSLQKSFSFADRGVFAVRASALGGDAMEGPLCSGVGAEVRLAVGVSQAIPTGQVYADIDAGFRTRGDGCERFVGQAVLGVDLGLGFRAMAKTYAEKGDGALSIKAEAMLLFDAGDFDIGVGYREEVSGRFEESAVVGEVWWKF